MGPDGSLSRGIWIRLHKIGKYSIGELILYCSLFSGIWHVIARKNILTDPFGKQISGLINHNYRLRIRTPVLNISRKTPFNGGVRENGQRRWINSYFLEGREYHTTPYPSFFSVSVLFFTQFFR
jgi:hypothetical protein